MRPGKRVALLETVVEADGREVLHARGWRIERPEGEVPPVTDGIPPRLVDETTTGELPEIFSRQRNGYGYLSMIDWRFLEPAGAGPRSRRSAWTRPRIPLLPGEETPPMARVLLVADSGSGVGAALPSSGFMFINTDLTVALPRDPVGEWLLLESSTTIGTDGTGLTVTRLADELGSFGHGMQTLLVSPLPVP